MQVKQLTGIVFMTMIGGTSLQAQGRTESFIGSSSVEANKGDWTAPGLGFSSIANLPTGHCVIYTQPTAPAYNTPFSTDFEAKVVDTVDDFSSIMQISASASMSYGIYGGDASASNM